ncbi:MAG: competence/damage-inducible protein A [Ruminococcaceae bacterium]|nr:competence/damage-inducible protein A [Oscillospiraceae bacterium]
MRAEIIAVGTELLLGQIVNTNAQYLSQKLSERAINVYNQSVVGDNVQRLSDAIKSAFSRSDMIIFTGGLGPTKDDLTKETIASYFGLKLVRDEESLTNIKERFALMRKGQPFPKSNEKQADMPEGCIILHNDDGTAPGGIIEKDGKIAIFLPGPPYEMKLMYEHYVDPYLAKKCPQKFYSKIVNIMGMGESYVAEQLDDLLSGDDPTVAPYAKEGEMMLRVTTMAKSEDEANKKMEGTIKRIKEVVGDSIYGYDDIPLENVVYSILKEKNLTLTTAESCTGGLIGSIITNVPGVSSYYKEGIVTYSNEAKMKYLGVKEETLKEFGAVSCETAKEMAEGALKNTGADIAVAVTGIAGPDGGTAEKKVGLVYISVADKDNTVVEKFQFTGDRQKVRRLAAKNAINMVRKKLLKIF